MPSAASASMIVRAAPGASRGGSRSSIRSSQRPPAARASSHEAIAATSEPACSGPVGEGAKRPTYPDRAGVGVAGGFIGK